MNFGTDRNLTPISAPYRVTARRLRGLIGQMRSKSSEKLPKYVYKQTVKGHTYYRFRKGGGPALRLPGRPGTPEFHTAYAKVLTAAPVDIGRYSEGSVAHTIHLYYRSGAFSHLKDSTKRDYRRYLDRLDRSVGERPIASLDSNYVHQLTDKLKDTPGASNHTVAVLRTLFEFAKKRKIISVNPADGIERIGVSEPYRRWPQEALGAFRRKAPFMMRLAMYFGVYTGQRLSDVISMKWSDYRGGWIHVRQQKTGQYLAIPVHPHLAAILGAMPRVGETILTSRSGRPFHSRVFSRDFLNARTDAGLPGDLSFHGLRHTAASRLAELGKSAPEIMAITGHKSLKLVEHYIRQASQELQAARAISGLGNV